ncbi:CRISPR-associated endonuclease Cas2 [Companilactobacillus hulinensis]|uniref:CRISPR-associated endonuclease Cas2 n=1 Tax=Companilactobacillus hulinensis TaxID=2486007 RepID=UPI0017868640|nr:CRISPR-associated endonuclease Cas2 [Companilactobacillus hulinensis]
MRLMVMFDLPTITSNDRRNYRQFRKKLLTDGFIMMQESIYTCLTVDGQSANLLKKKVALYAPSKGLIQAMVITEKQFSKMEYISGIKDTSPANSSERFIVL